MPAFRIYTETIIYADDHEDAWNKFGEVEMDELAWDIEIVKTD